MSANRTRPAGVLNLTTARRTSPVALMPVAHDEELFCDTRESGTNGAAPAFSPGTHAGSAAYIACPFQPGTGPAW